MPIAISCRGKPVGCAKEGALLSERSITGWLYKYEQKESTHYLHVLLTGME